MAPRPGGGRLRLAGLLPAGCHTSFPGQQGRFLEKLLCCSGTSCEGDPWALLRQLGNLRGGRAKPGACGRSFLFLFLSGLWSVKWEGGGPGAGEASEPPSVGTRCPSAAAAPGGGLWGPARSDPTLASHPPPPQRPPALPAAPRSGPVHPSRDPSPDFIPRSPRPGHWLSERGWERSPDESWAQCTTGRNWIWCRVYSVVSYFLFVVKRADGALGMSCCLCGPPRHTLRFTDSRAHNSTKTRSKLLLVWRSRHLSDPPVGSAWGCPAGPQL